MVNIIIDSLYDVFITLLLIGGIFPLLIGLLTVFSWALRVRAPADKSNRINRIRLWWFAISAPHRFTANFQWLYGDEVDNLIGGRTWEKGEDDDRS